MPDQFRFATNPCRTWLQRLRWLLLFLVIPIHAEVVISEFVAENDSGLQDADGDRPDWIELHNNGAVPVSMAGWHLTENPAAPMRWPLPDFSLNPGERRVIFASGKDRRDPLGELHTDFSLQNSGGYLALRKPDGTKPSEWNPYPPQRADIAYGSGALVNGEDLLTATSSGKYLVPSNGSLGAAWTGIVFDDSAWSAGSTRLGYQSATTPPGLPIAYWTFDDTTNNEIAAGPRIELLGAAYDPSVPGSIVDGKSLHFTRTATTYATALLDVSETAYTVSFWFRTSSPTAGLFAVHAGNLGINGHDRHLFVKDGNIGVRTYNAAAIVSTDKNYADSQWHHVAHVYGASVGGQRVYVDGVLILSGTKAQSDFTGQDRVTIGFSNDATGGQYHDGEIDDVAIWSEAMNSTSIQSLAAGTNPLLLSGFGPYIGANVETALRNVNASLYVRLPFAVNRATPFNTLTLRVRYDDGFVAYLDGVEVARRNAPSTPAFDSAAIVDRPANDSIVIETIDISPHAALLTNGNHVLAFHALNDTPISGDFLLNAELSGATLVPQSNIYLDPPTPGQANDTGFAGFVADTTFLPKRGFYDVSQNVVITSATPGASIAYTTDGTDPTPTNGIQVPPANAAAPPTVNITVSSTTSIRAIAYKSNSGLRPTNLDSHTYIFPIRWWQLGERDDRGSNEFICCDSLRVRGQKNAHSTPSKSNQEGPTSFQHAAWEHCRWRMMSGKCKNGAAELLASESRAEQETLSLLVALDGLRKHRSALIRPEMFRFTSAVVPHGAAAFFVPRGSVDATSNIQVGTRGEARLREA
jgi:hypothetical protein